MRLTEINQEKYPVISKEEAIERIKNLSETFIEKLKTNLYITKCEEVNMVGLGNSLSSGWSATDHDVRPFLLKLQAILQEELDHSGVKIDFHNYSLCANNCNEEIYRFLLTNPSELDVKKRFQQDKQSWDYKFYKTFFQNYIPSDIACSYYPETEHRFLEDYHSHSLTITHLNGCTGGILNAFSKNYPDKFLKILESYYEDLEYLKMLILYLKSLKEQERNIITIGNFPYVSTKLGWLMNGIILNMNKAISKISEEELVYYFDKNQLAFFQEFVNPETNKKELKMDNHPTIEEQYTVLYYYFKTIIQILEDRNKRHVRTDLKRIKQ